MARLNRERLQANATLVASDLLDAIRSADVIVSNPPYIASADVDTLAAEVRDFEPHMALTPGPLGTEAIERILRVAGSAELGARSNSVAPGSQLPAPSSSSPGRLVLLEVGFGQEERVRAVAKEHRFRVDAFLNDLAGIPRVVVLSKDGE